MKLRFTLLKGIAIGYVLSLIILFLAIVFPDWNKIIYNLLLFPSLVATSGTELIIDILCSQPHNIGCVSGLGTIAIFILFPICSFLFCLCIGIIIALFADILKRFFL